MDEYTDEYNEEEDEFGDGAEVLPSDPFDGLTKREQDTFFRVLDLVSDDLREGAIIYFMDHPAKIRTVIEGVKIRKEMIANKDTAALTQLFEQENIHFENAMKDFYATQ